MICIDPGQSGGIVADWPDGSLVVRAMPKTDREISDLVCPRWIEGKPLPTKVAYLEDIVFFTGNNMPSSSGIKYGASWGFLRGLLTAYQYRIVLVPPKKWQSSLGLGGSKSHPSKTAWKAHLKNRAEQLFPKVKVTLATADALCIYEAAKQGKLG